VAVHDVVVAAPPAAESGFRRYPRARLAAIAHRVRRRPATVERKREQPAKVVCRASSVAIAAVGEVKNPRAVDRDYRK